MVGVEQRFGDDEVERRCYLDILSVSFGHGHLATQGFYDRSVVGKRLLIGLVESLASQSDVENLRCLHDAIVATQYVFAPPRLVDIA